MFDLSESCMMIIQFQGNSLGSTVADMPNQAQLQHLSPSTKVYNICPTLYAAVSIQTFDRNTIQTLSDSKACTRSTLAVTHAVVCEHIAYTVMYTAILLMPGRLGLLLRAVYAQELP